jgi:mono/diheme cytochrome c family protein
LKKPYTFCLACLVGTTILAAAGPAVDAQNGVKSTRDGAYSKEQAARGASAFKQTCHACHTDPKFAPMVLDAWDGLPLGDLFEFVSTSMPEDNPGALPAAQYADILAHFLSLRGLPPGEAELAADVEALRQIQIEKPE